MNNGKASVVCEQAMSDQTMAAAYKETKISLSPSEEIILGMVKNAKSQTDLNACFNKMIYSKQEVKELISCEMIKNTFINSSLLDRLLPINKLNHNFLSLLGSLHECKNKISSNQIFYMLNESYKLLESNCQIIANLLNNNVVSIPAQEIATMYKSFSSVRNAFKNARFTTATLNQICSVANSYMRCSLIKNPNIPEDLAKGIFDFGISQYKNDSIARDYIIKALDERKEIISHHKQNEQAQKQITEKSKRPILKDSSFVKEMKDSFSSSVKISAAQSVNNALFEATKFALKKFDVPQYMLDNKLIEIIFKLALPVAILSVRSVNESDQLVISEDYLKTLKEMSQFALQQTTIESLKPIVDLVVPTLKNALGSAEFKQLAEKMDDPKMLKE